MAAQSKRVVIDGFDYEITQLGALAGRKLWLKLLHVLAEPLKALGALETFDEKAFATIVAAALEGLEEETAEELYESFGVRCTVRIGERFPQLTGEVFDQHFAGRYVSMSKWLYECTVYNFAGFLGDTSLGSLGAKFKAFKEAAGATDDTKSKTSPNTSTGTSGESSPTSAHP